MTGPNPAVIGHKALIRLGAYLKLLETLKSAERGTPPPHSQSLDAFGVFKEYYYNR